MLKYVILPALAMLSASPGAWAQATNSCTVRKTEITAANALDQTTSPSFVNVGASGAVTFTSAGVGCISGTFSAAGGNVNPGDNIRLQVLLDGAQCAPLTGNQGFAGDQASGGGTYSADFFCGARVALGPHTVQVQFHSGSGGNAQIYQRILSVRHD